MMIVLFFSTYINTVHLIDALRLATKLSKSTAAQAAGSRAKSLVDQVAALQPNSQGIIPIKVLQQGVIQDWPKGNVGGSNITWDQVKAEDGANCGYHALKNVVAFMNALKSKQDGFIQDLIKPSFFFDCMRVWVPIIGSRIIPEYGSKPCVNWLQGNEIEKDLIDKLYDLHSIDSLKDLNVDLPIYVVEWKGTSNLNEVIADNILTSLANVSEKIIGFVWNDTGGHWVGIVLDRSNSHNSKVYYLDSMNPSTISSSRQRKIHELVMMSPANAHQKLLQYQQKRMSEDLNKMESDLDILQGHVDSNTWVYPFHLGCCQRDNAIVNLKEQEDSVYFECIPFTKEQLESVDFAKFGIDINTYLPVLNALWVDSLSLIIQSKLDPMSYVQRLAVSQKRFFDVWYDGREYTYILIDQYCHNTNQMLKVVHDKEESYFDPVNAIHAGFTNILVGWKNYNDWDAAIAARVTSWCHGAFKYLNSHRELLTAVDWTTFGEVPNQVRLPNIKAVIAALRHKIEVSTL